jgi:uncharacterized heparinase superfamily protein
LSLLRMLNTVRHLRRDQVIAQVSHRVRRLYEDPARLLDEPAGEFPGCQWSPRRAFLPPMAARENDALSIRAGRLRFVGRAEDIGWPPSWDRAGLPKLWLYNLHYFDYIHSLDPVEAKGLVDDWIRRYPPARDQVGWEPYPISLRIMNWCGVFFGTHRAAIDRDPAFRQELWSSLCRQARWLERHVETHLMGNHLLENAAALVVAGTCFAGSEASRWYGAGRKLLQAQLSEQILPDGGHFERSPMYHTRVVYLLALLVNGGDEAVRDLVAEPLRRAAGAMTKLTHPDGRIALLNDSAFGIYNPPDELAAYSEAPPSAGAGPFALPDSGYFGMRTEDGAYVICDAAPIGPDHQPGHAHGDMLSFELSVGGHRVVVDSGVYDYEAGPMRAYCRSTRAHNTVEVDGEDQCEFWGAFRVARRGGVRDVSWSPGSDGFRLSAWHDGYRRLPGRPIHERTFEWHGDGDFVIRDTIRSDAPNRFAVRLHLDPQCGVTALTERTVRIDYGGGRVLHLDARGEGRLALEEGLYCPTFGTRADTKVISWHGVAVPGRATCVTMGLGGPNVGRHMDPEATGAPAAHSH